MERIIRINNCVECPFYKTYGATSQFDSFDTWIATECTKVSKIIPPTSIEIPKWCPLEESIKK